MKLEILSRKPKGRAQPTKLLFVHGICVGAWVWAEHFLPYFAKAGYEAHALSLRGHAGSEGHEGIFHWSLEDYTNDLQQAVETIGGPVIVIGHSLGGAIVQNWLRCGGKAEAAALLASVPPWGLGPSAFRMAMSSPRLFQEFAKIATTGIQTVDHDVLREAMFSHDVPLNVFEDFTSREQDESRVVSAEVQGMRPFAPMPWQAPRMLVIGAANDRLIPTDEVERTATYYGTNAVIVEDMAHSMMVDTRWEQAAEVLKGWFASLKHI